MFAKFFLGANVLAIGYEHGIYVVREKFENWVSVRGGSLEDCLNYCSERMEEFYLAF